MAQAARLSSRMQKELKLLLTDPPPGASFPILSDDSSISSLTSIDALFEGPQGTVYSNGVFKIRIQIPERYPFQPPVVTFATPIYHPNIDTGGRICLDILNLPPKGTWQPSLNISTILTSIGLLLSEPNPDDGLMEEASKEYKYNRQAFDQIARSMTEKYARVGGSESSGGSHVSPTRPGPSTAQIEKEGSEASPCSEGFKIRCNKLSLKSPQSSSNSNSEKEELANSSSTTKCNENLGKSLTTRSKLSLAVSLSRNGISMPNQYASMLDTKTTSNDPPDCFPSARVIGNQLSNMDEDYIERSSNISATPLPCVKMRPSRDPNEKLQSVSIHTSHNPPKRVAIARERSCSTSAVLKKVGPVRKIPNLGSFGCHQSYSGDEKENMTLVQLTNQSAANGTNSNEGRGRPVPGIKTHKPLKPVEQLLVVSHSENSSSPLSEFLHVKNDVSSMEKQQTKQVHDGGSTDKFQQHTEEGPDLTEAVIVLDSEDEDVPVRSKLLLPKRCLSRKRKGNLPSYR